MNDFSWAAVLAGLVLIFAALLDIFMTVLHTQIESPISNGLARGLWRILTGVAEHLPERTGGAVLAWGAPTMILCIIVFWATLLVVGFGLLYLPVIHNPTFFAIAEGHGASPLEDAMYHSAVSLLTIGYGDIVAVHSLPRALNVVQGGLGLLTISMAVTYLLSVYP